MIVSDTEAKPLFALESLLLRQGGRVLQDVSLGMKQGEILGILGRAGAGETLLRDLVLSRLKEKSGALTFGVSSSGGKPRFTYLAGRDFVLTRYASTLGQLARIVARRLNIPLQSAEEELRLALERLPGAPGPERLKQKPQDLTPRERALSLLGAALAQNADAVVADDPAAPLDPIEREEFLRLLIEQHARLGFALLYFTGDPATAARLGGRIAMLRNGFIVEEGSAGRLSSTHAHAYTQSLFRAVPRISNERPPLSARAEPLLQVRSFAFEGAPKRKRLDPAKTITFELRRGASLALIGTRGSGRRSIARAVLGLERVPHGQIILDSVDIGVLSSTMRARLRRRIAFIDGNDAVLDPRMSVAETVLEPMRASFNLGKSENTRAMEAVLKRVGLTDAKLQAGAGTLDALGRRRLQVARALSAAPQLLVLYEPLSKLDVLGQALILDLLKEYRARENVSFLLITADFAVAKALCENALIIRDRNVVESGALADLIAGPTDAYTASLLSPAKQADSGLSQGTLKR